MQEKTKPEHPSGSIVTHPLQMYGELFKASAQLRIRVSYKCFLIRGRLQDAVHTDMHSMVVTVARLHTCDQHVKLLSVGK